MGFSDYFGLRVRQIRIISENGDQTNKRNETQLPRTFRKYGFTIPASLYFTS